MKRWFALVAGSGLAGAVWAATRADEPPKREPSLRELADRAGLTIGAAVDAEALATDPTFAALAGRHFHVLTPENALKWGHVEWQIGERDTRQLDAIAAFAKAHNQRLRGHTLVWDLEIPAWVDQSDAHALDEALVGHLRSTLRDNRRRVDVWDVVNEALGDDGQRSATVYEKKLGPAYIAQVFRLARAEAPDAKLFYNDYAVLWPGPKADGLLRLVDGLLAEDVPIQGVGLQSHLHLVPAGRLDWNGIEQNIRRIGERGLEVHLTEVDVRVADLAGGQEGRLLAQAEAIYRLVSLCRNDPACTNVTFWGVTDRYSWVDRTLGPDDPLLWDDLGAEKPAYHAVRDALSGLPWRGCTHNLVEDGDFSDGTGAFSATGGRLVREEKGAFLRVTDRTERWHGPQVPLTEAIAEGLPYAFSAKVRVPKAAPVNLTLRIEDGLGERYQSVAEGEGTGKWQTLAGTLQVDLQAPVRAVHLYVEGPVAGQDVLLDDVSAVVSCAGMVKR